MTYLLSSWRKESHLTIQKKISGDCIIIVKNLRENWSKFVHDQLNVDAKLNLLHRDSHLPAELQNSEEVQRVERVLDVNFIWSGLSKCRLFQAGEEWDVAVTSLGLARAAGNAPRLDVNLIRSGRSKCRLFQAGEEWDVAVTSLGLARAAGNAPRLVAAGGKGVG